MKAILDVLYKWCNSLHRKIQSFTSGFYVGATTLEFTGGTVSVIKMRYHMGGRPVFTTYSYTYSGSGTPQTETWTLGRNTIVSRIIASGCTYLKVGSDILIS